MFLIIIIKMMLTTYFSRKGDIDFVLGNLNAIQRDLKMSHVGESYIYGGFVRDLLRDEPYQDTLQ